MIVGNPTDRITVKTGLKAFWSQRRPIVASSTNSWQPAVPLPAARKNPGHSPSLPASHPPKAVELLDAIGDLKPSQSHSSGGVRDLCSRGRHEGTRLPGRFPQSLRGCGAGVLSGVAPCTSYYARQATPQQRLAKIAGMAAMRAAEMAMLSVNAPRARSVRAGSARQAATRAGTAAADGLPARTRAVLRGRFTRTGSLISLPEMKNTSHGAPCPWAFRRGGWMLHARTPIGAARQDRPATPRPDTALVAPHLIAPTKPCQDRVSATNPGKSRL